MRPPAARRIVGLLLLLAGAALVLYALSDHPLYGGEPGFGRTQAGIAATGAVLAACAFAPLGLASRVLLLAVSSLIALAAAELAGEIALGARLRPVYQADERLIFRFIPQRTSVMTRSPANGGVTVSHRINKDGFRGDELKASGAAPRVVVYGDSFIHAFYTPQESTYCAQLAAGLRAQLGQEFEVINAGVSSYGPDQVSVKMEQELPRLRPELAIVAVFAGNDYGDLLRNKMFRLGADGRLVSNAWTLDPKVRALFELSQKESILKRALPALSGRERPRVGSDALMDPGFLLAEAEREYRSFVVQRNDMVVNTHMDYYSADVSLAPDLPSAQYKRALMHAVLARIRDVARREGVPLVFLFIPHPVDVADGYDGWRIDPKRYPGYQRRNLVAPLESAAEALGVPFVSLHDAYRQRDANRLYFHGGDDHWNEEGQKLAADLTVAYLLARNLPAGIMSPRGSASQR